jgi:hypothetical protein
VTFYSNQENVQDTCFTKYYSANLEILQLSLPIDTTLEGFKYSGKVVVDMVKIDYNQQKKSSWLNQPNNYFCSFF